MSKENRIALVTGGTSGIGKEIAVAFAKKGIRVCINFAHSINKANQVKEEIERNGGNVSLFQADVTNEKAVSDMFDFVQSRYGALDILVNNAGIYEGSLIEDRDYDQWKKVIDTNLNAKLLCTMYAVSLLKASSSPVIINIGSRSAEKAESEASAYCSAAAAISMLTKVSALELAKYNIRVNTVSPGLTRTPLTEKDTSEEEYQNYVEKNPLGRLGTTQDIANTVLFLISLEAGFINGENINVSGGILLT